MEWPLVLSPGQVRSSDPRAPFARESDVTSAGFTTTHTTRDDVDGGLTGGRDQGDEGQVEEEGNRMSGKGKRMMRWSAVSKIKEQRM